MKSDADKEPDAVAPREEAPEAAGTGTPQPIIVGIGASAGGLEALQKFFAKMPEDTGICFVVVTHMHPERESLLAQLLSRVTSLEVVANENPELLVANRVIVAKDSLLQIQGMTLVRSTDAQAGKTAHHPIDYFFRQLAEHRQHLAIGIVLSGGGNDGTLGLKSIKECGGMVMAHRPDSAIHPSMPQHAVDTGLVDYVLAAEVLPEALVRYCHGPFLQSSGVAASVELTADEIQNVLVLLRTHTRHDFTQYKQSTMGRRIQRRLNVHGIKEASTYLKYAREHPNELHKLQQELLISVTSFFRDPAAFEALAQQALPALLSQRSAREVLRVWLPGCATGEEAYSVAILLHEQMQKQARMFDVQMFATDLNPVGIEKARKGCYPDGIAADLSTERLNRYFTREVDGYQIHKSIRAMVVFAEHNLLSDPPYTRMDLIVCRNVLIYLNTDAQQHVFAVFHYALSTGGLLFLGNSEAAGKSEHLFEVIDSKYKILRNKVSGNLCRIPALVNSRWGSGRREEAPQAAPSSGVDSLTRDMEHLLLSRFVPCSLLVDANGSIYYVHGRAGRYLEPEQGKPRNNLLQMAREGLAAPLATALREAAKGNPVVRNNVPVRTNGGYTVIDFSVEPLTAPESLKELLLVVLEPAQQATSREAKPPSISKRDTEQEPLESREELERELQITRQSLQSTIEELETSNEELKSTNEELQSTNEELHSSNEEMESSREELQSLNEELNTINAELESKVTELAHAHDDMHNLFNSIGVGTIFLDTRLQVKRFTRQVLDVFKLIDTDLGRPLADLTSTLVYPDLLEDAEQLLTDLKPVEKEVQDKAGCWYLVQMLPYRTGQNLINGVVITIHEIDRLKRAEAGMNYFECMVETVRQPLLVLDDQLRVQSANEAFYQTFSTDAKSTRGQPLFTLGNGQWNIPALRQLLEELLPREQVLKDYRVEHLFPRIGQRTFMLNARQMHVNQDAGKLILLSFEELAGGDS